MDNQSIPQTSGIYKITCINNGKIYIGSSNNLKKRRINHFSELKRGAHRNPYLQRAYDKYGKSAFIFEIVELVETLVLLEREQYWINIFQPFGIRGFNILPTANRTECSLETRKKLSDAGKGRIFSPETRLKLSASHKGKTLSPDTKAKLSAAKKGSKASPETKSKMSLAGKGRIFSDEHKQKISAANKGRIISEESRIKNSESNKGRVITPEQRQKISASNMGHIVSSETREKLREAHKGKTLSPEHCQKIGDNKRGKTLSPEHRQKISDAGKGRILSPEARQKLRKWHTGKTHSPETLEKMRGKNRSKETCMKIANSNSKDWIVTTPDGMEIKIHNLNAFCRENGLSNSAMAEVASGKYLQNNGWKCRHTE